MKDKNTISKVKYKVFEQTSDNLLKVAGKDRRIHPKYYSELFETPELAAQSVFSEGDEHAGFLILPLASWDWKE